MGPNDGNTSNWSATKSSRSKDTHFGLDSLSFLISVPVHDETVIFRHFVNCFFFSFLFQVTLFLVIAVVIDKTP